jgi:hypothetical protein
MRTWLDSIKPTYIVIVRSAERPVGTSVMDTCVSVTQTAQGVSRLVKPATQEAPEANVSVFRWDTSPAGLIGWPDGISLIWQGKAGSYRGMSEDGFVKTQEGT